MNVFIVGLGLIGASYAEKLTEKGHQVYGYDIDTISFNKAKDLKIIEKNSQLKNISDSDVVIFALYPEATLRFIKQHINLFKPHQTLTDVSGIKGWLLKAIHEMLPASLSYTSHHPMAGKETRGIDHKNKDLFKDANFLIISSNRSNKTDISRLNTIAIDLEFSRISIVSAEEHDQMIAYTSQLTHLIAAGLIQSHDSTASIATGDSFKDLTRIAKINAPLWSELFLKNKPALIRVLHDFQNQLTLLESLLNQEDKEALINYLNQAKKRRESYD